MKPSIKKQDLSQEYFFEEGCFITEISNSIDDPTLSIARARVEPGKITKWHYLINTTERYLILEGVGEVEIGGLKAQTVHIGDTVIIPPTTHQRIRNIGTNSLVFLAICSPRFNSSNYVDC